MNELLQQLNRESALVAETLRRSLVQVRNGRVSGGAGTIWHGQGLILTNSHVVQSHSPEVILSDGRVLPSRLLAYDRSLDLAALAVEAQDLPTIDLGDSRGLRAGEWVIALGHPWGVVGSLTAGVVIAVGRPPEMADHPTDLIQVDLHLRPGYSGGPLVDTSGRLVGINTMAAGPNVGLAIPVHVVKAFLRDALGPADRQPRERATSAA